MPDFVLDALNQCLPSKEQEESVLNAPPQQSPNTLEVPTGGFTESNHLHAVHNHTSARSSRSLDEGNVGCLIEGEIKGAVSWECLHFLIKTVLRRKQIANSRAQNAPKTPREKYQVIFSKGHRDITIVLMTRSIPTGPSANKETNLYE